MADSGGGGGGGGAAGAEGVGFSRPARGLDTRGLAIVASFENVLFAKLEKGLGAGFGALARTSRFSASARMVFFRENCAARPGEAVSLRVHLIGPGTAAPSW